MGSAVPCLHCRSAGAVLVPLVNCWQPVDTDEPVNLESNPDNETRRKQWFLRDISNRW